MGDEFEVVIAGGGIAGLTAGMTSARLGRKTLIVTGDVLGGQLASIDSIDGFPGFPDGIAGSALCPMIQDQAAASGAEFVLESVERIDPRDDKWCVTTGTVEILACAVVLATGSTLKKLDIPGEERLTGKGVSHCASCDGPLFRDRVVAVIGGGDSAMQEALMLAEFASSVIIFNRDDAMGGQASYRDRVAAHHNIEIRPRIVVSHILGEVKVTGLRVLDSTAGKSSTLEAAAVFPYVGLQPNSGLLADRLNLDSVGRIPTDGWMRTGLIGICAAGNVRSQSSCRAASAAGDGATAAVAVDRYLANGSW